MVLVKDRERPPSIERFIGVEAIDSYIAHTEGKPEQQNQRESGEVTHLHFA